MAKKTFDKSRTSETFIVSLSSSQGECWRGNIVWVGGRCQQQFTSMQELMELMGSTMYDGEKPEENENREERK